MSALSRKEIWSFCDCCNWAYDVWITNRTLYDNLDNKAMEQIRCAHALSHLSIVTQEYCLLQIAKLHDPAFQKGSKNLSLQYVIDCGGWDEKTKSELKALKDKLDGFAELITKARHKVIAHNDHETIMLNTILGEYSSDKDIEYFETLQEFVNIVHDKSIGGPYPFCEMAKNDAKILLAVVTGKVAPLYQG